MGRRADAVLLDELEAWGFHEAAQRIKELLIAQDELVVRLYDDMTDCSVKAQEVERLQAELADTRAKFEEARRLAMASQPGRKVAKLDP